MSNISQLVSGKLPSRKIAPRSESGFGLGLALELGLGAIFLGGNFPKPISVFVFSLTTA